MWTLLLIVVGILIGWNLPQPLWAKNMQVNIAAWWRESSIRAKIRSSLGLTT